MVRPTHAGRTSSTSDRRDLRYRALGYSFQLIMEEGPLADVLSAYLAPFRAPDAVPSTTYRVTRSANGQYALDVNETRVPPATGMVDMVNSVLWDVQQSAIRGTSDLLLLHASVGALAGRAVALPAPMDSGKTTLVAGLVRSGFSYLSDEVLALDPGDCLARPFPKALRLEGATTALFPDVLQSLPREPGAGAKSRSYHYVAAEALRAGAIDGQAPLPVRLVVFPRYEAGSETLLQPMSRAEALVALVENSFNFKLFKSRGIHLLQRVLRGADCYRLRMGDLASAVEAVRRAVEAERSHSTVLRRPSSKLTRGR
jgi:hypothetical protein